MPQAVSALREQVSLFEVVRQLRAAQEQSDRLLLSDATNVLRDVHAKVGVLVTWLAERSGDAASFRVWAEFSGAGDRATALQALVAGLHATLAVLSSSLDPVALEAVPAQFIRLSPFVEHLVSAQTALDRVFDVMDSVEHEFSRAMDFAEERGLTLMAMCLAEPSLTRVWDNDDDAEYDALA